MSSVPIEGFVIVAKRARPALKFKEGYIAWYTRNTPDGRWAGKKVAATWMEHPWAGVDEQKVLIIMQGKFETAMQLKRQQSEWNRLVPPVRSWSNTEFQCMICGVSVNRQIVHFNWHTQRYIDTTDIKMQETLEVLFG